MQALAELDRPMIQRGPGVMKASSVCLSAASVSLLSRQAGKLGAFASSICIPWPDTAGVPEPVHVPGMSERGCSRIIALAQDPAGLTVSSHSCVRHPARPWLSVLGPAYRQHLVGPSGRASRHHGNTTTECGEQASILPQRRKQEWVVQCAVRSWRRGNDPRGRAGPPRPPGTDVAVGCVCWGLVVKLSTVILCWRSEQWPGGDVSPATHERHATKGTNNRIPSPRATLFFREIRKPPRSGHFFVCGSAPCPLSSRLAFSARCYRMGVWGGLFPPPSVLALHVLVPALAVCRFSIPFSGRCQR